MTEMTEEGIELEDTQDSMSSQPGANLIITTDDDEREQLEGEQQQGEMEGEGDQQQGELEGEQQGEMEGDQQGELDYDQQEVNDELDELYDKQLEMDAEGGNENGDDSTMDISTGDGAGIKLEDVDLDEVVDSNPQSVDDTESALVISTEGSEETKKILQNGVEPSPTEENTSCSSAEETKPLLSGLLGEKKSGAASTSSEQNTQQQRSFSVSDGNVIANELEVQIGKLTEMLVLKEKEWSSILRLKKHMEYALEQVKCTQRMAKVQDEASGDMSTSEIKAAINLITAEPDIKTLLTKAGKSIEESIESAETENESLQSIFPFGSGKRGAAWAGRRASGESASGQGLVGVSSASQALQKLCERKRKAMDDAQPPSKMVIRVRSDAQPISVQGQRVITSRGGTNLVTSRNRSNYKLIPRTNVPKQLLNPDRMYSKTLEDLMAKYQNDKQLKESAVMIANIAAERERTTPAPQITNTRTLATSRPKNGKPAAVRTSNNSLLIANPSPGGSGTLAKMLSPSTHAGGMSSNRGDASSNASQKFSNKLPTSDTNLSLANLLATSKVDSKVTMKIKKERITREEDASHAPAQQQSESVPICQGCNLSRAQFVCAGCANQWYCSRECQVAAWDEHSEICSG